MSRFCSRSVPRVFWLTLHCVSADFRCKADDNFVLLGSYTPSSGNFVANSRKKYRSQLQESNIFCLYSWSLRMGTICWTEASVISWTKMSVINYHHSLRNNQDVRRSLATLHNFCQILFNHYTICSQQYSHKALHCAVSFRRLLLCYFQFQTFSSKPLPSNTLKHYYSLSISDQIFHPTKANGRITV